MNCDEFQARILAFVDGELGDEQESAEQHAAACEGCGGRAAFERALEERIGAALLSGASLPGASSAGASSSGDGRAVAMMLERARPAARPRARLVTLRRVAAVAAALLITVQAAWFFCIPPFECSLLQAVERGASGAAAVGTEPTSERLRRLVPPAELDGFVRTGPSEVVAVGAAGLDLAVRAHYARADGEEFTVLWCDPSGHEPSFRRHTRRRGADWWVAYENGHSLVAWMCPVTDTMCTLVGAIPEDRLVTVASEIRDAER